MLHLDAMHSAAARTPEVFALKPPDTSGLYVGRKECTDKCCFGPLRQAVVCPKSMLSLLPSTNDIDRTVIVSEIKSESGRSIHGHIQNHSVSTATSELRNIPTLPVPVTWSSPTAPTARSPPSEQKSSVHESAEAGAEPSRPCRGRLMNGPQDRPAMTGSNNPGSESLNWLADVAAASATSPHPPPLLPGPGSLFRPPITPGTEYSSNTPSRLYSQYPIHSSYYGGHNQAGSTPTHMTSLGHFTHYYPLQFSPSYNSNAMMPRPYAQMESYPTVLSGMGSHPRSAFLPSPSQYSPLPPSTTSPAYQPSRNQLHSATYTQALHSQYSAAEMTSDSRSPKEGDHVHSRNSPPRCDGRRSNTGCTKSCKSPSPPPSSKSSGHPPPTVLQLPQSIASKELNKGEVCRDQSYRVPSGKEGSLKHRILTRPPDILIDHSAFSESSTSDAPLSARSEDPQPSPKRAKPVVSPAATSASMPSTPLRPSAPMWRTPSPSMAPTAQPAAPQLHYPAHFMKGSVIQLANGELKRVEELRTEDFVSSAEICGDLKIDSSTVVRIEENTEAGTSMLSFSVGEHRVQVTVEASLEHPFFVFGQGWSSCFPERTMQRYNLVCHKLTVGDVCISLTHRDTARSNTSTENIAVPPSPLGPTAQSDASTSSVPPQTHSIETQTSETLPAATVPPHSQTQTQRKRRWSAPDKLNEEAMARTKLS